MNKELKHLAEHALLDSFYTDFCALVNGYVAKATEFDQQLFEIQLQEKANVFSRNETAHNTNHVVEIHSYKSYGYRGKKHATLFEALKRVDALLISINRRDVFIRENGEWQYIGDKDE